MTTQSKTYPETGTSGAHKASEDGRGIAERFEAAAPEISAKFHQVVDSGKAHAREWTSNLQGGVRERPVQSLLIAASVGIFVGWLLGRRNA